MRSKTSFARYRFAQVEHSLVFSGVAEPLFMIMFSVGHHDGDPNKLSSDGFWRTLYLCLMPYRCNENLASDEILKSRTFRVVANPFVAILAQALSFYLLWKLVGDLKFVLVMWVKMRIFVLWVNMIQNYWTHTRQFGYRRYDDDNAMNIGEWLPVTASFNAGLQNSKCPTCFRRQ
jgi:fatty-acid desaturase